MLPGGKRYFLIITQLNRVSNLPENSNNHATLTESEASLYWINTTRLQEDVMPDFFLVINQGTTDSTALLIGHDLSVHGRYCIEFPQPFPKLGWVEHNPGES